jgi:hypothetical protein
MPGLIPWLLTALLACPHPVVYSVVAISADIYTGIIFILPVMKVEIPWYGR